MWRRKHRNWIDLSGLCVCNNALLKLNASVNLFIIFLINEGPLEVGYIYSFEKYIKMSVKRIGGRTSWIFQFFGLHSNSITD